VLYRAEYLDNGHGIYELLKGMLSTDKWKELLNNENINWLPKPLMYKGTYKSFFTEKGYNLFREKSLPIIEKYLNKDRIVILNFDDCKADECVYMDEYQCVIDLKAINKYKTFRTF